MNQELQDQLTKLLKSLLTAASDAKQFAAEQIPPLIKEKILLGRVEESVWMLVSVMLFVGGLYIILRLWKWALRKPKGDEGREDDIMGALLGTGVFGAASIVPIVANLHTFLLVWFAPRLYIVEWLKDMVK